jgi:YegS/Rv2252/BmrU family lipid kinase
MENNYRIKNALPVKLIFIPASGQGSTTAEAPPQRLLKVIEELQHWNLIPEVFLIEPDCDLEGALQDALERGIELFVVCGGDGTLSSTAHILCGSSATLGIIPQGTQNNVALSLGIPADISQSIALLRTGATIQIDMGRAVCGTATTPFLEVCSVGLVSALFPHGDDIQHGKIEKIGDFLSTFVSTPPAEIHLEMEDGTTIKDKGYIVLVKNMPYIGLNYQLGPQAAYKDGLLDVLYFADLNKLELLAYILQGVGEVPSQDSPVQYYHVRQLGIRTTPAMPVMIDGLSFGEGNVDIQVHPGKLNVPVPSQIASIKPEINPSSEQLNHATSP